MERSKIEEMKASIRQEYEDKISKLKKEMENVLSALYCAEVTLAGGQISKPESVIPQLGRRLNREPISTNRIKTADARILLALEEMDGDFSRNQLLEKANNDNSGKKIKDGTYSGIFSRLIKNKKIIVVKEKKGNQGGIYRRAESHAVSLNPSTFVGEKGV